MTSNIYEGKFSGDYKSAFTKAVDELLAVPDMPTPFRISAVDVLIEAYFTQTGEKPSSDKLSMLADFLLRDELSAQHADKVSREAYPILSRVQLSRRETRELPSEMEWHTANRSHKLNGKRAKSPWEEM